MTGAPRMTGPGEPPDPPPGARSRTQDVADFADLQAGLSGLASLVAGSLGLQEMLHQVAMFAQRAIPGADGAGVTLLRIEPGGNRIEALAASADFVKDIDHVQYSLVDEGPCITAALERITVRCGDLGGSDLWPHFGPRVGRLGVHSALSLPLVVPDQLVGAINVYARQKHVFDDRAVELGELFAAPAAVAVHNARLLTQARTLATQLQTALTSRPVIDQAVGLLRGRTGISAEEAFARLRTISQTENVKVVAVAQRMVDEAVRRARARSQHNATDPQSPE
jgi:GAF domain-containing protein